MSELEIASAVENYTVTIDTAPQLNTAIYDAVIADAFFESSGLLPAEKTVFVTATEDHKNLAVVHDVCEKLRAIHVRRNSRILAVGGGMIQDISTMTASIYMRGIGWDYAPTTLTSMLDSCLGGKSSINVGSAKNLVGNIYPPKSIAINTQFAATLEPEALISGLAEGVKIAYARGDDQFAAFIASGASEHPVPGVELEALTHLTLSAKKWFIEIDEFDRAERQLLNFGHSFGHAFEAASHYGVQHGTAVALGMLAAAEHPNVRSSEPVRALTDYCTRLLAPLRDHIAAALAGTDWDVFDRSLFSDKKNTRECLVLILPNVAGRLERVELPFADDAIAIARTAIQTALTPLLEGSK